VGLIFSVLAAVLFGVAAPKLEWSWRSTEISAQVGYNLFRGGRRGARWRIYALVLLSVGLCHYSNLVHYASYTDPRVPSKYPWWLSMALCVIALVATRFFERNKPKYETSPKFTAMNYVVLAVITLIAGIIRMYDIVDTPVRFNDDNIGAISFAGGGQSPSSWIVPGLGVYGIPALALVFLKISAWFTAPDIFGTRLPEAILGTVMVTGSYLLVWRSFDSHRLAALCAALLTVHAGHIHFSRHIMNVDPWTFVVLGFLFLTHGVRSQRAWAIGAAGMTLSFSLHLYLAVRVLLVVIPLFGFYLLRHRRATLTRLADGWILFAVGALVVVGPNLADMRIWKDLWEQSNRSSASFLHIQTLYDASKAHNLPTVMSFFEFQALRVLLIPQVLRDTSSQITMDKALFDLWIAPFLWLGLGTAIASWRRSPAMVLNLLVCGTIMALGQMLFNNIPYWPKLIFFMFTGCLWIAMGMLGLSQAGVELASAAARLCRVTTIGVKTRRVMLATVYAAFAALIAFVGHRQWEAYAIAARRDASAIDFAGRFVYNLPRNAVLCGVMSSYDTSVNTFQMKFYAQGRTLKELGPRPAVDVADQCGQRPFGWIISPDQGALKDKLVQLYPDGELKTYSHKYGQHLLWTFYVP
jgi:4-amino-4-deoxy-L-arabinose transferase-like glycosyltransferase